MMALGKELTKEQIDDAENLGKIKQKLPPNKWILFKTLMLTYLSGIEAGISLEEETQELEGVTGRSL